MSTFGMRTRNGDQIQATHLHEAGFEFYVCEKDFDDGEPPYEAVVALTRDEARRLMVWLIEQFIPRASQTP